MPYDTSPSAKLVATQCSVCGRPLVDAPSLESGIGPICREKYGFNVEVDEDVRKEANQLVYQIACDQAAPSSLIACDRLEAIGFPALANIIRDRLAVVVIRSREGRLVLSLPYFPSLTETLKRKMPMSWDKKSKTWSTVDSTANKVEILKALRIYLPGRMAVGSKGYFQIEPIPEAPTPAPAPAAPVAETAAQACARKGHSLDVHVRNVGHCLNVMRCECGERQHEVDSSG